jgi:hypothetical protein
VITLADPCGGVLIKCVSDAEPDGWGPYRIGRADILDTFASSFSIETVVETVCQGRFDHLDDRDPAAYFVELKPKEPPTTRYSATRQTARENASVVVL